MIFGYKAGPEQFPPIELLRYATEAEKAGFEFLDVSDHFHPWAEKGQSCFTWTWLGALAVQTSRMTIGPGVTCPILRYHPAIIAQASATLEVMASGRTYLAVGTGDGHHGGVHRGQLGRGPLDEGGAQAPLEGLGEHQRGVDEEGDADRHQRGRGRGRGPAAPGQGRVGGGREAGRARAEGLAEERHAQQQLQARRDVLQQTERRHRDAARPGSKQQ